MATKIEIYRETLLALGEERISGLDEECAARFAIDDHYDRAVAYCLEQGFWNFAIRTRLFDPSGSVTPQFGFSAAFEKPADWVRTFDFSASEAMAPPLLEIVDEAGYWYANCDPLYVRYVSNDADYGLNLSRWPESYFNYVTHRLALRTCKRITGSDPSDELRAAERRARADALSKDAMNEPVRFAPAGSWSGARSGGSVNRSRWNGQMR